MTKILYIDMDGVLCDFDKARDTLLREDPTQPYPQSNLEFWHELEPIPGALEAIKTLEELYDIYILSKPSSNNLFSYSGKALWVKEHLSKPYLDKLILTPNKTLHLGDYLVDDRPDLHEGFIGEIIPFTYGRFKTWQDVTEYLIERYNEK